MNSALYLCLMVGLCSLANSDHQQDHHEDGNKNIGVSKKSHSNFHSSILDFGIQLYKQFATSTPHGKNILFSPIGIAATLALLSLGARAKTHTQILEGIGFNLKETSEKDIHSGFQSFYSTLSHANDQFLNDIGQALFLRDDLKPLQKFLLDVHKSYKAYVSTVNFKEPNKAEKIINDYVKKNTHGKITEVVKGLDPETAIVIVNYIFFIGNWKKPFDPKLIREQDFFVNNETIVKVPMMYDTGWFDYYIDRELSCRVLRMDYNTIATALFILPDKGKFKQVENALSRETINKWRNHLHRETVDVHIPKFTISTTHDLKEPLNSLGIDIFSDQTNLSGITGKHDLKVSKVTHKTALTVNEMGKEATGANVIEMMPISIVPSLEFNRPFMIGVQETATGGLVFLGKVENPALS